MKKELTWKESLWYERDRDVIWKHSFLTQFDEKVCRVCVWYHHHDINYNFSCEFPPVPLTHSVLGQHKASRHNLLLFRFEILYYNNKITRLSNALSSRDSKWSFAVMKVVFARHYFHKHLNSTVYVDSTSFLDFSVCLCLSHCTNWRSRFFDLGQFHRRVRFFSR